MHPLIIGTRGSSLALAQANWVRDRLREQGLEVEIEVIKTTGDTANTQPLSNMLTRGVFVTDIETALLAGEIDIAVHSMKDLPALDTPGLVIAAVPTREDPRDALISSSGAKLVDLPEGAVIGTSSPRRKAQLLSLRPDLKIAEIRGNIDTRIRKLENGDFNAICLAVAGLNRLGLDYNITECFDPTQQPGAAGQGALAVQCKSERVSKLLQFLDNMPSRLAVEAERAVLAGLGGGCGMPLGVYALVDDRGTVHICSVLYSADGSTATRATASGTVPLEVAEEVVYCLKAKSQD